MNKKAVYLGLFIIASFIIINAAVNKQKEWESAEDINVSTGNFMGSLQEAINNGLLKNLPESTLNASAKEGHNFNEIMVSIDGQEMTLQEALEKSNVCGLTGTAIDSYNSVLDPGHYATEVEVNISGQIKSLQEAIDAGEVLYTENNNTICYNDDSYWEDSCNRREDLNEDCVDGFQGDYYCTETDEDIYRDEGGCLTGECYLNSVKTFECDGSCSGGDCYGPWSDQELYCAGFGSPPEDTCPGSDESNPYTCGSATNTTCNDVYITRVLDPGETQGACGLNSPYAFVYVERTNNCYAPE